jgi:hypothetical protein
VNNKLVNAGYLTGVVPSMTKPKFEVAEGMTVVPPNDVHDIEPYKNCKDFVVVGGGKTSMDCVIHLREIGVDVSNIRWIVPTNCWIIDRDDWFLGAQNEHYMGHYTFIPG